MRKIEVSCQTVREIIHDYTVNIIGTPTIAEKYRLPKKRVIQILKENDIQLDTPGRRNLGGKSASDKRHYQKHKAKRLNYYKEWRERNNDHLKEYYSQWRKENPEKVRETKRNYERKRKNEDGIYKLIANFRTALYTALKEQNAKRHESYFRTLGYTQQELVMYLEAQFKGGMSWENYGEWHVDHIKPIASFTFRSTSDPNFKECWSLNNLQPLWGLENISKGCK